MILYVKIPLKHKIFNFEILPIEMYGNGKNMFFMKFVEKLLYWVNGGLVKASARKYKDLYSRGKNYVDGLETCPLEVS